MPLPAGRAPVIMWASLGGPQNIQRNPSGLSPKGPVPCRITEATTHRAGSFQPFKKPDINAGSMEFVTTGSNDPQEFPGFEFLKAKDAGLLFP